MKRRCVLVFCHLPVMYRFPCFKTVALDLETTGINRERDRVIQYGVFGVEADGETEVSVHSLVDAEVPTGRDPKNIPGVRPWEVTSAVPLADGHLDRLFDLLDNAVVVMHHRQYDWAFIEKEFARNHHPVPVPRLICCTWEIARRVGISRPHTLTSLCQRYRISLDRAHNAHHDSRATFQLFVAFANQYWDDWFDAQVRFRGCWSARSKYWLPRDFPWVREVCLGS